MDIASQNKFQVPSQNSADNNNIADVIGNKDDSTSGGGDSIYAQNKFAYSALQFPSADSANNNNIAEVVGNKDDTAASGNSVMAYSKKVDAQTQATKSGGVYEYTDAGGEQDVVTISPSGGYIVHGIWLDLSNMTQNGTVKLYMKIDGTNYRQVSVYGTEQSYAFTVADAIDGVYIPYVFGISEDFKVTYTEGADEGATRPIPYLAIIEKRLLT